MKWRYRFHLQTPPARVQSYRWFFIFSAFLALPVWPLFADDSPFTIPLEVVNIGTTQNPEYKLGIYVGLGGGAPELYEFDTGGSGFFATYDSTSTPWWNSSSITSTGQPIDQSYSSGIKYDATIVTTSVQIYGSNAQGATPLVSVSTDVGQINTASGDKVTNWDADLQAGTAPLYGNFYGDFGAGLTFKSGKSPDPAGLGLYSILPQLSGPGGIANGYIIRMGGTYLDPTATLQIGITDADRAQFSNKITMTPSSSGTFPNSNETTYSQEVFNGNLDLNGTPTPVNNPNIGAITDTGAPTTEIHNYGGVNVPNNITGVTLTATDAVTGQTDTLMQYTAEDQLGFNAANVSDKVNNDYPDMGYVNTGLNLFFQNNVLYDLQNSQIDFQPNVLPIPEPSTWVLMLMGVATAFVLRRAQRPIRDSRAFIESNVPRRHQHAGQRR